MSDTETNRKIVTVAFEGWRDRGEHIGDLFADRMTWRIENSSLAAGDYADKADFFARVLTPFGARFAGSAEPFRPVTIRSIHADGDTVIVYFEGRGVASDGVPYENTYAWFLRMEGGKVVDGAAFFDGPHFDDLWTRITP
ncbi:nuclear transport factor 2 family protein [Sporichthya sp.]|uniref:nuclear transport factor 2 family protein n=1 Tax=Sporichthya sp. TaxID=65475 RepID=UPI0017D8AF25|nr:nuclear transport factor 2 family protein [Sporichthya sp.]MBA3743759.1 nuclear transport factor 2 family protein [Sporichthya sp.]